MSRSLPEDTLDDIDAAISRVFARGFAPTGSTEPSSSARKDARLANMIMTSAHESMARLLRAQNARNTLFNTLPHELWCHIWSFLPFCSRIAVSHTCSSWRTVSVGCPDLWTDLTFYVTAHAKSCHCSDCLSDSERFDDDEKSHQKGWAKHPYPEDSSNVSLAPIVLPRSESADLPLFITVHIVAFKEQRGVLSDLASALEGHCDRVRELDIRAAELLTARGFMEDVGYWPALRHLTVGEEPNDLGYWEEGCCILPGGIELPALTTVSLVGNASWPNTDWHQDYPSVLSVDVRAVDSVCYRLQSILTSCENLRALDIDMEPVREEEYEEYEHPELQQLALGLRSVRIRNLCANYEDALLDAFQLPTRPTVELEYYSRSDLSGGVDIFHDLGAGIRLCIESRDRMLSVRGTDANGRTRRVAVRFTERPSCKDFSSILCPESMQCFAAVHSVAIDGSLWFHLIGTMSSYPSLVSLEIVIDNTTIPWVEAHQPWLPALQSLTLLSYDGVVNLSARMIALFVTNLKLPLPIEILNIDHRLVPGPPAALRNIARDVNIGVYHVPL